MPDMSTTDNAAPSSRRNLRRIRLAVWLLVALALLGFGYLWLTTQRDAEPGMTFTRQAEASTAVEFGGPFTLTGADGRPFSSAEALQGKPYVIFFGFTNCPDVCPNTLARLAGLRKRMNAGERPFEIVFVTVDPERDTPQAVGSYAQMFNTPIIGLTGTIAEVEQVAKSHGIYTAKVKEPSAPDGYTVDHGAAALLFGKDGKFVATIAQEETDAAALAKLRRIVA